jgi:hypothetical protein
MATAVTPAHDGGFQFITTLPNQTISVEANPVAVAAHAASEFQRQGVDVLPSGDRALSVLDSDVDLVSNTLHTKYHCGWSRGEEEQPGRTIMIIRPFTVFFW